jgi:hypothetical protein
MVRETKGNYFANLLRKAAVAERDSRMLRGDFLPAFCPTDLN